MTRHVPLVTIVTPVLNAASSIGLSLASVATQTHPRIEHIVIDGGSTDGTIEIIRSFAAVHPVTWISEPDDGLYPAVNKGLALAKGDVLAYLNADDLYLPWSVGLAAEALSSGADLCYGDLGVLRGRKEKSFLPNFYPSFDPNLYAYFRTLAQPTVFWRRSVYEGLGGFDVSYRNIGDCEYWLRAGTSGYSYRHLGEVLAIQFDHGGSLTNRLRENMGSEFGRMRRTYREVVGTPAPFGKLKSALGWRARMLQFYASAHQQSPRRWSRFLSWLKENEIAPRRDVLRGLLPSSMWPGRLSFADGDQFLRALHANLSKGSLRDVVGPLRW